MNGALADAVTRIMDDPAVLGLGDLEILRVLPSDRADAAGLLFEGGLVLYVVDLQLGPTGDRQVIRALERWAAVRRQHANRRCFAVLVAERIEPRYRNVLRVIGEAVPIRAMEMREADDLLRFTPVGSR